MNKEREALKALIHEMEYVLSCINAEEIPFDGDDFHEALRLGKEALDHLAQPEQEKERCVGCEACIDTACGRDECPKGWPKAAQPEQEPTPTPNEGIEGSIRIFLKKSDGQWERLEKLEQVHEYNKQQWAQRPWVGLTDEEKSELWEVSRAALPRYATYASLVEAKLKEKNT